MAEQEVTTTAPSGGGEQETVQSPQGTEQSTSPETLQVEQSSTDASSTQRQGRSQENANRRVIENAVKRSLESALQEKLNPLIERLSTIQQPPAQQNQAQETPDWNNLNSWMQQKVQSLLEERLRSALPPMLNQFQGRLQNEFQSTVKMQEARNYLISQKDVGRDENKLAEIRQTMEENLLDYALDSEPLEATRRAVEIWRQKKVNPNTPQKSQLTTVTGGTATTQKGTPTVAQIRALQDRIANNPTMEQQEQLEKEIDALFK